MKILINPADAYAEIARVRNGGSKIGLIPTMGALHEGHLTLAKRSKAECDYTVVTIFVNPTQFAPNEDFSRYPRTLEADLAGLRGLGVDAVFTPTQDDLYPAGYSTYIDPPAESAPLEGVCRPGHFRGVATIVLKLFQILPATVAYFGQKDYQQLTIIRRMVEDLNVPVRIQGCPTVREADGLAMSSRNRYLSEEQRQRALCLWRALSKAKELFDGGERRVAEIETAMAAKLSEGGADRIEYARVVDASSLASYETTIETPAVALIAARVGQTRLIDNLLLWSPLLSQSALAWLL